MVWCAYCLQYQPASNTKSGLICCAGCGKVVDESLQSEEPGSHKNVESKHDERERSQYARKMARLETKRCKGDIGFHEVVDCVDNKIHHDDHANVNGSGKLDNVSALHDAEIARYLLSEGEKQLKTLLWERLNRRYLKNQSAKKRMAGSRSAKSHNDSVEMSIGDGAKSKGRPREQSTDRKRTAAAPKSSKKNFSSKINYDKLDKLRGETMNSDNPNKRQADSGSYDEAMSNARLNDAGTLTNLEGNEDEGNSLKNFYGRLDEEYCDYLF